MLTTPVGVNSAQQGVSFGGFVGLGRFCLILLVDSGTIAPNVGRTVMSSREAAGKIGRAQIRTSRVTSGSRFVVSVDAPAGFTTAPANLSSPVNFQVAYSAGWGVYNFSDPHGNPNTTPINSGNFSELAQSVRLRFPRHATRLDMDLQLDANIASGTFPTGDYAAEVTVRCE